MSQDIDSKLPSAKQTLNTIFAVFDWRPAGQTVVGACGVGVFRFNPSIPVKQRALNAGSKLVDRSLAGGLQQSDKLP